MRRLSRSSAARACSGCRKDSNSPVRSLCCFRDVIRSFAAHRMLSAPRREPLGPSRAGSFAGASVRVTRPRAFELNQVDGNIARQTRDADLIVLMTPESGDDTDGPACGPGPLGTRTKRPERVRPCTLTHPPVSSDVVLLGIVSLFERLFIGVLRHRFKFTSSSGQVSCSKIKP